MDRLLKISSVSEQTCFAAHILPLLLWAQNEGLYKTRAYNMFVFRQLLTTPHAGLDSVDVRAVQKSSMHCAVNRCLNPNTPYSISSYGPTL